MESMIKSKTFDFLDQILKIEISKKDKKITNKRQLMHSIIDDYFKSFENPAIHSKIKNDFNQVNGSNIVLPLNTDQNLNSEYIFCENSNQSCNLLLPCEFDKIYMNLPNKNLLKEINEVKLLNTKGKIKSDRFALKYNNLDKILVQNHLKAKFSDIKILTEDKRISDEYTIIKFNNRKTLYEDHSKLAIKNLKPVDLISLPEINNNTQIPYPFSVDNPYTSEDDIFQYCFSSNEFELSKNTDVINSNYENEDLFLDFFLFNKFELGNEVCDQFKKLLIIDDVRFLNENIITIKLFNIISNIKKKNSNLKLKIIACDYSFNEYIQKKNLRFRLDFVYIFEDELYVYEMKYRPDRSGNEEEALRCIYFRKYAERILNALLHKDPEIFNKIKKVNRCGLGISGPKDFEIGLCINSVDKSELNLVSYKTLKFRSIMRKNYKRFKNKKLK
jgi:hypothetical protein